MLLSEYYTKKNESKERIVDICASHYILILLVVMLIFLIPMLILLKLMLI